MLQPQDIYNSSVKNIVIKSQMRFFTAVLCYSTQQIHRFVSATSLSNMYPRVADTSENVARLSTYFIKSSRKLVSATFFLSIVFSKRNGKKNSNILFGFSIPFRLESNFFGCLFSLPLKFSFEI